MTDDARRAARNTTAANLGFVAGMAASTAYLDRRQNRRDEREDRAAAREQEAADQHAEMRAINASMRGYYPEAVQREADMFAALPNEIREPKNASRNMTVIPFVMFMVTLALYAVAYEMSNGDAAAFIFLGGFLAAVTLFVVLAVRSWWRGKKRDKFRWRFYDQWDAAYEQTLETKAPGQWVFSPSYDWPHRGQ